MMPKCVVEDPGLALGRRPPRRAGPGSTRSIYEAHVKGLTQLHPDVPQADCAAPIAALGAPGGHRSSGEARRHRRRAHADPRLRRTIASWSRRGLRNYWGYSTLGFFRARAALPRRGRRRSGCKARSAPCTMPASRSSSTSSTTTPRRATISARRCRSAASTTPATTSSRPTTRASTGTRPAPATR